MRVLAAVALLASVAAGREPPSSFAPLIRAADPAVVSVSTLTTARRAPETLDDLFRRFAEPPVPRQGVGSGFVVSADGEIVTNAHVVEGAQRVQVQIATGQVLDARLVGVDPMTDVALLRVDAPDDLPVLPLGDSDRLQVGDWVLAIGSPFGLTRSATAGIVSAKGRFIGSGPYDDFIQTDAAINPGNSGGPLIDLDGRVVGVNTAILAPSGGNVGIGFAIPANLARWVMEQLRERGRVVRGWLGIAVQAVTPDLARSFGLDRPRGALVADVTPGGPGARAGLRRGDVIVRFGDQTIKESRDLPTAVAMTDPGETVSITVVRDGDERTLRAVVGEMPAPRRQR